MIYSDALIQSFFSAYINALKAELPKVTIPDHLDTPLSDKDTMIQAFAQFNTDVVTSIVVSLLEAGDKATEIVKVVERCTTTPSVLTTFMNALSKNLTLTYVDLTQYINSYIPGRLHRNYVKWVEQVKSAMLTTYATL